MNSAKQTYAILFLQNKIFFTRHVGFLKFLAFVLPGTVKLILIVQVSGFQAIIYLICFLIFT